MVETLKETIENIDDVSIEQMINLLYNYGIDFSIHCIEDDWILELEDIKVKDTDFRRLLEKGIHELWIMNS